jgi:hypothetical protein
MDVPPVLFQIGIHAGKRAFHDRISPWVFPQHYTGFTEATARVAALPIGAQTSAEEC